MHQWTQTRRRLIRFVAVGYAGTVAGCQGDSSVGVQEAESPESTLACSVEEATAMRSAAQTRQRVYSKFSDLYSPSEQRADIAAEVIPDLQDLVPVPRAVELLREAQSVSKNAQKSVAAQVLQQGSRTSAIDSTHSSDESDAAMTTMEEVASLAAAVEEAAATYLDSPSASAASGLQSALRAERTRMDAVPEIREWSEIDAGAYPSNQGLLYPNAVAYVRSFAGANVETVEAYQQQLSKQLRCFEAAGAGAPSGPDSTKKRVKRVGSAPDYTVEPQRLWAGTIGEGYARQSQDDELLFVDHYRNTLTALDLRSGDERWRLAKQNLLRDGSEMVFTVEPAGTTVSGFDRASGERRWSTSIEPHGSRPTLTGQLLGDTLVVSDEQEEITKNFITGLNPTTGAVKWRHDISLPGQHTEAGLPYTISDATDAYVMFSSTRGHTVVQIDIVNGRIKEQYELPVIDVTESGIATLQRSNGRFLVETTGRSGKTVRVYDSLDEQPVISVRGQRVSDFRYGDAATTGSGTDALAVGREETLTAVGIPDGKTLWTTSLPSTGANEAYRLMSYGPFFGLHLTPSGDGGFDATLDAYSFQTGNIRWSKPLFEGAYGQHDSFPNPRVTHRYSTLFANDSRNTLAGFDMETGTDHGWRVSMPAGADYYSFNVGRGYLVASASRRDDEETDLAVYAWPDAGSET